VGEGVLDALVEGVEGGQLEGFGRGIDEGGRFVAQLGVSTAAPADGLGGGRRYVCQ
jgi:hypothetical protein